MNYRQFFTALVGASLFCLPGNAALTRFPVGNTTEVLNFVKPYLPENPVIVEAGAFDGRDSVTLVEFFPKGTLYTFEPVPELYKKVLDKVQGNPRIHTYPLALSDKTAKATFHLSVNNSDPGCVSASSSLLAPKEHLDKAPYVQFPNAIEVDTITIDEWATNTGVPHIDFFWLDMQGYELNTLKASQVAKNSLVIWTEIEFCEAYKGQYLFKDILAWMTENDFELVGANVDVFNPSPDRWYGDALFVKKNLLQNAGKAKIQKTEEKTL